jgi:hypothetical protein
MAERAVLGLFCRHYKKIKEVLKNMPRTRQRAERRPSGVRVQFKNNPTMYMRLYMRVYRRRAEARLRARQANRR